MSEFRYDELSVDVWEKNYQAPGETSRKDTWERCARSAASVELDDKKEFVQKKFFELFQDDKFIPGGRIMANLGVEGRGKTTLFNCYVHNPADIGLHDPDSIDGIYTLLKAQARTLQSEGGYGINASFIRPAGLYIAGIGSRSPGVLKFMELWDKSSEIITQGSTKILGEKKKGEKNKIRKGAQMLVLSVFHPDIEEFIVAKQTPHRLTKFNMSVGIIPGFMDAVKNDLDWDLVYPDTTFERYASEWNGDIESWKAKDYPIIVYKTLKARELWDRITQATYNRAEPGILNLDLANKLNPTYYIENIATSNPCGEIVMSTGVCNLASFNLPIFVKEGPNGLEFDFESFGNMIEWGVRFLDNVNVISTTPLPEYDRAVEEKRRIGLGVMGLGSLHLMLGLRYGSKESLDFVEKLYKLKSEKEILASAKLGAEKGSFKLFDAEKHFSSYWWTNLNISEDVKREVESIGQMRNSHQSMNAPTGNTGIYARNVSGGIEPVFSYGYSRWVIVPEFDRRALIAEGFKFPDVGQGEWFETDTLKFTNRGNEQILFGTFNGRDYEVDKSRGLTVKNDCNDYGWNYLLRTKTKEELDQWIAEGRLATAQTLSADDHINVLAVIAHYTNQSNSKTINVPNDYPYESFKDIYLKAYDLGIKGVTTYRDGTMTAVLETSDKKHETKSGLVPNDAPKRPKILDCDIHQVKIKGEEWTIFIGLMDGQPFEVFGGKAELIKIPKKLSSGKLIRNAKKAGESKSIYDLHCGDESDPIIIKDVVKTFKNPTEGEFTRIISLALRHGAPIQHTVEQLQKDEESDMYSFSRVVARVLKRYIKEGLKVKGKVCPDCGSEVHYTEGCQSCTRCTWSKCG